MGLDREGTDRGQQRRQHRTGDSAGEGTERGQHRTERGQHRTGDRQGIAQDRGQHRMGDTAGQRGDRERTAEERGQHRRGDSTGGVWHRQQPRWVGGGSGGRTLLAQLRAPRTPVQPPPLGSKATRYHQDSSWAITSGTNSPGELGLSNNPSAWGRRGCSGTPSPGSFVTPLLQREASSPQTCTRTRGVQGCVPWVLRGNAGAAGGPG